VLWSERGPLAQWYQIDGGPIGIWRAWADDVQGRALPAGYVFPEELPAETALALRTFFRSAARPEAV
jgi:haloacetate dehalogenase